MNKRLLIPAIAIATLAAMVLATHLVMGMGKKETPKKAPRITLLTPPAPPPPPPPPPKFEKKPDPPKEQKEMKIEPPQPKQDTPPPSPELKMDGPAGNGASAFGAGKITSDDLSKVGSGKPGGTGDASKRDTWQETNYENLAKGEVSRYLRNATRNKRQGNMRYTAEFLIWTSPAGAIQRSKLLGSNGDADTDALISEVMAGLPSLSMAPPPGMEQPIKLRVRIGT